MIRRALALAVVLALSGAGAAGATIEPPPVTLPPIPAPVSAALGVVGPVLATECGTLLTAITLVLPAVGSSLPVDPVPLVSSVVQVCGSVPQPAIRFKCGVDETVASNLANLLGSLRILLAIINPSVAAPVVGELAQLGAVVPAALLIPSIEMLAQQTLQCQRVANAAAPKPLTLPDGPSVPVTPVTVPPEQSSSSPPLPAALGAPPVAPIGTPETTNAQRVPAASSAPLITPVAQQAVAAVATGATPVGSAIVGFLLIVLGAVAVIVRRRRLGSGGQGAWAERSTRFISLPASVRGRASTKSTERGHL
jgi:hypothetical protein